MPRSGNGLGTVHFGRADQRDDGSYVTTVWFAVFFLPIFPIRSERILPLSEFDNGAGHRNLRYSVLENVPRHRPQIIRTYLVGWGILAWYVALWWAYAPVAKWVGGKHDHWIPLIWVVIPFALLLAWQRWFVPRPKLTPVEVRPGSEFSTYRRDGKK